MKSLSTKSNIVVTIPIIKASNPCFSIDSLNFLSEAKKNPII